VTPFEFVEKSFMVPEARVFQAAVGEDLVIDPSLRRFWLIHPCDRRMDVQTDGQTELWWLRCTKVVAAFARKNATYGTKQANDKF